MWVQKPGTVQMNSDYLICVEAGLIPAEISPVLARVLVIFRISLNRFEPLESKAVIIEGNKNDMAKKKLAFLPFCPILSLNMYPKILIDI